MERPIHRAADRATTLATAARLMLLLALPLLLAGCLGNRATGAMFDDQNIELRVIASITGPDGLSRENHVKVEVYERVVLLMGETVSQAEKDRAGRIAAGVDQVERVVNEIEVRERVGVGGKLSNSWLSTKVNTRLLTANTLPGFDPQRVKVVSARGTVYLMGNLSREEGDRVAEVVRNVRGVDKVVKVFNYSREE